MAKKLLVLNVVGLTPGLLGDDTPRLRALAAAGFQAELGAVFPAVTCSAQSTMLTGQLPREHGIVGNGWYFRDLSEIWLWRQSNRLVTAEKVWERLRRRRPGFTCAKLFWWYNMYSSADWSVTPRPVYHADGRKSPSIYTEPAQLKRELEDDLGEFPLFHFWGPGAGIRSSEWIGRSAQIVLRKHRPDLTLVYLPHLDYDLQRHGPLDARVSVALRDVDRVAGEVIDVARELGMEVLVVSEYGITEVVESVSINRVLRRQGFLRVQETIAGELLDAGASRAFAVCDHQMAHVYVNDATDVAAVKALLEEVAGVEQVLDGAGKERFGLDHERAGELVAVSEPDRWFDYYYWLENSRAPDFARTVDIHRKPGYDPVELLLDPELKFAKQRVVAKLLGKQLGLRYLLDVISLESRWIRGSHGRLADDPADGPILISSSREIEKSRFEAVDVASVVEEICA